jgi:hypothetical protein
MQRSDFRPATVCGWGFLKATIHVVNDVAYVILLCCQGVLGVCANDVIMIFANIKNMRGLLYAVPPVYQFE